MIALHVGLQGVHIGSFLVAEGAVDGLALLVLAVHVPPHFGLPVRDVGTAGTDVHCAPLLVRHLHNVHSIFAVVFADDRADVDD